jgi:hypothetical protein
MLSSQVVAAGGEEAGGGEEADGGEVTPELVTAPVEETTVGGLPTAAAAAGGLVAFNLVAQVA